MQHSVCVCVCVGGGGSCCDLARFLVNNHHLNALSALMSRIEREHCLISSLYFIELFEIFILLICDPPQENK